MVRNPNQTNKFGCYAYFPGTGPAGRVCAECGSCHTIRGKVYCKTFSVITGKRGTAINSDSPACREFQRSSAPKGKQKGAGT